eukprot:613-Alexandrium_andersonii.AAC.1
MRDSGPARTSRPIQLKKALCTSGPTTKSSSSRTSGVSAPVALSEAPTSAPSGGGAAALRGAGSVARWRRLAIDGADEAEAVPTVWLAPEAAAAGVAPRAASTGALAQRAAP